MLDMMLLLQEDIRYPIVVSSLMVAMPAVMPGESARDHITLWYSW